MENAKISFIVVNWNGKKTIAECLDSILSQTYPNIEIICIDNFSSDGSLEIVKEKYSIDKFIALNKNYGYARANNIGFEQTSGEYIALVNNDAILSPDWLEKALAVFQRCHYKNVGSVATKNIDYYQRHLIDTAGVEYLGFGAGWDYKNLHVDSKEVNQRKEVFGACATAALYKKKILNKVGLFDSNYFIYFEDTELAFRLRLFGYTCVYEPEAVCYHYGGDKRDKNSRYYLEYGRRNIEFLFFKNMQGYLFFKYFLSHCAYEIVLFLYFLSVGKGIPFLKAKVQFLKSLDYLLRERKKLKYALKKAKKFKDIPRVEHYFLHSSQGLWDKVLKAKRGYGSYLNSKQPYHLYKKMAEPKRKRLLFLNRCFYPDVEATGQFLTELCEDLEKDFEIHVICGNPLYRKVKNWGLIHKTHHRNITIWRVNNTTLPKRIFPARVINLISYFIPCFLWTFLIKRMDCIIAETDPPLLASIAYVYSRIRCCRFIYYSQDIWPQVGIVNEGMTNPLITTILKGINRFLYKKADRIIVLGRDMKKRLEEENFIPSHKIGIVENWADPKKIFPIRREDNPFLKKHALENKFIVMYSGNIGLSQDLENIVHTADSLKEIKDILFVLIGEGASKEKLIHKTLSLGLPNVKFLPYQEKDMLKFSLNAAHVHLITLKKGMKGYIVPSKVYGIMASGRPFIAAVDKECEIDEIVQEFHCGLTVPPSNVKELQSALLWAYNNKEKIEKMGENGRKALEYNYSRKICTQKFKDLL
ncbi:glycosyltransferase [Acidobacteriota bacterium]